jgi:outer membrane protein, heavy metal efflux system
MCDHHIGIRLWRFSVIVLGMLIMIGGCTAYHPHALPEHSSLASSVEALQLSVDTQTRPELGTHEINPADGLDLTEVAILAVLNNPELKVERTNLKVSGAQLFAAGLLPDPHMSYNLDHPTGNASGLVNGWGFGFGYDLLHLITRQADIAAERQCLCQVNLNVLWQEWQVMQQARSLSVRYQLEEQRLSLLRNMLALYDSRYRRSTQGLAEGNITLDVNGTDLTALVDTYSQISQLEQSHKETHHDLNLVLGLAADAAVPLTPLPEMKPLSPELLKPQLQSLSQRRPDFLALLAGYQSQEAKLRAAILEQFPSLSVGVNRASDTSAVYTSGLNISLELPIFSGNRGHIAVERATREQLREEYLARLAQTDLDVKELIDLQGIIARQIGILDKYLPRLKELVERARSAYGQGDIEALTFLNMESTWVNKQLERISLEQNQWENRIALETLLALPESMPAQALPIGAGQGSDKQNQ